MTKTQDERIKAITLLQEIAVLLELARADEERYYSDPTLVYELCAMLRAMIESSGLAARPVDVVTRITKLWKTTMRPQRSGR